MTDITKTALIKAKETGLEAVINYYFQTKTPKEFILQKPGPAGMSFKYVSIGYVISQLNIAFGFNWEWKIIETSVGKDQVWLRGELTLKDPNGNHSVSRSGVGGSAIKKKRETGEPLSIGNDIKAADSDALKVAAAKFGIGADVKFKEMDMLDDLPEETDHEDTDESMRTILMRKMFAIASQKGFSEEEIDFVILKDYSLESKKDLTIEQLREMISRMESK